MKFGQSLLSLLTASLIFSTTSYAENFNYNSIEVGYLHQKIDGVTPTLSGSGLVIGGGFDVYDNLNLSASYASANSIKTYGLGASFHQELNDTIDWTTGLNLLAVKNVKTDKGYQLTAGLRAQALDNLEVDGGIAYNGKLANNTGFTVSVGAGYNLIENLQLSALFSKGSDVTSYGLGVRYYLGK